MSAQAVKHTTKNLMNYLAAPSRVASKMDWKRQSASILAVDIGPDRIGMAVAPHPSSHQPIRTLEPLPVTHDFHTGNRRVLSQTCVKTLASIVQEHQVCALLVSWPVQHEGRCGKPCGQVLHALDSLVQQSEHSIVTNNRPVCLWDDRHVETPSPDHFGRDPLFGNAPSEGKTIHVASQEQYQHHVCSSAVAAQVWQDFSQTHWPQMDTNKVPIIHDSAAAEEEDRIEDDDLEESQQLKVAFM